ncbi:MAG: hypothetical protein OXF89_04500 [Rhodospirillaceae bacterium]|nr:hypothetical protein [Rhodospirillaceae bacterium]MCY4067320.1 hypothetical protein [Rhodospirillaceae bacterium]
MTVEGTGGTYTSFTFRDFNFGFDQTGLPSQTFTYYAVLDGVAGLAACSGCAFAYTPGQLRMTRGSMTFTPEDGSGPTILGTDARTDPDADYLMAGTWLFVPDSAAADHQFGAFADGSDPFEQTGFAGLTGEAIYHGHAFGVRTREMENGTMDIGRVFATARLRANFERNEIAGLLTGFYVDDVALVTGVVRTAGEEFPVSDFVMTLGAAPIGTQDSGFFTGEATIGGRLEQTDPDSRKVVDATHTGTWSGQFFGNGEPDGKPGSVAGTFGVQSSDGTENYFGAFGAPRREK